MRRGCERRSRRIQKVEDRRGKGHCGGDGDVIDFV